MKGKPWTAEEEKQLRELCEQGKPVNLIAATMNKSPQSVQKKIVRLNLKVVVHGIHRTTTTRLSIPDDLPSIEEALRVMCAALDDLQQGGLDQTEVLRLRTIIQGVKIYKELFADYVNYREIEAKIEKMEEDYERLISQAQSMAPKPAVSQVVQSSGS
jgi:hypothetical protein